MVRMVVWYRFRFYDSPTFLRYHRKILVVMTPLVLPSKTVTYTIFFEDDLRLGPVEVDCENLCTHTDHCFMEKDSATYLF
jgi:hypothetical protein